jgi:hypothetical protein
MARPYITILKPYIVVINVTNIRMDFTKVINISVPTNLTLLYNSFSLLQRSSLRFLACVYPYVLKCDIRVNVLIYTYI